MKFICLLKPVSRGEFDPHVTLHKSVPFCHLYHFQSVTELDKEKSDYKQVIDQAAKVFEEELADFDIAFTHDFIFTDGFCRMGWPVR